MTREDVYAGFFAQLSGLLPNEVASPFKTASRVLRHPQRVQPEEQPALFVREHREEAVANESGIPIKWRLHVEVYVMAHRGNDESVVPSSLLNPLIDRVMNMLKPARQGERQTLGGLVYHCHLSGAVEIFEGSELAGQAVAVLPVQLLTAEL